VPLADCDIGARITVLRLENEAEDLLHYLMAQRVHPGMSAVVAAKDGELITLAPEPGGEPASVTLSVAETVSVTAEPSPPPRTALPEQLVLGQGRYGR
jgi:DtxR family Mn-dependent transcriptional regulator